MKTLLKLCALAAFTLPSISAHADDYFPFSNLIAFGDSLTDVGNGSDAPRTRNADGSPAQIWINILGQSLGLGVSSSNSGGSDYAYSGALTGSLNYPTNPGTTPTMTQQLSTYFSRTGGHADPNALYTVWGGANDMSGGILYAFENNITGNAATLFGLDLVHASTGNIVNMTQSLHAAGANYILVGNLPNLGATPALSNPAFLKGEVYSATYANAIKAGDPAWLAGLKATAAADAINAQTAAAFAASATLLSANYNSQLLSSLNATGFKIIQVDIGGALQALQRHYAQFGFNSSDSSYMISTESPPNPDGSPVLAPNYGNDPNPNHYIFYDGYHPSAETDLICAEYYLSVFEGPMFASMLAEAPLSVMDAQNQQIQSHLLGIQTGTINVPLHTWRVFATGAHNDTKYHSTYLLQPNYTQDGNGFTVGADYRLNPNTLLGFAVGRSMGKINYAHDAGGFDLNENIISFFGDYQFLENAYVDGMLSYGNIDFDSIHRNFMLGIVPEMLGGSATGQQYAAFIQTGYNFNLLDDRLKTGPLATIDAQRVVVNPYTETSSQFETANGAFDALQYNKQTNDSLLGALGWQASYATHIQSVTVMPYIQATYNHQFLNTTNNVEAGVTTLSGSVFSLPVRYPDIDFGLVNAGVQTVFANGVSLTFGYSNTFGEPDLKSQIFTISASVRL